MTMAIKNRCFSQWDNKKIKKERSPQDGFKNVICILQFGCLLLCSSLWHYLPGALVWRRKASFIPSYATILGNAGQALTVAASRALTQQRASRWFYHRSEQAAEAFPYFTPFNVCVFLHAASSAAEAHSRKGGNGLLIMHHNGCCISLDTGNLWTCNVRTGRAMEEYLHFEISLSIMSL